MRNAARRMSRPRGAVLSIVRPASEGAISSPATQGDGGPSDSYANDEDAIVETQDAFSIPDVPGDDPDTEQSYGEGYDVDPEQAAADDAGFDHDDDESTGGQDMPSSAPSRAPAAPVESWNWRDRRKPTVPAHMYTSPRHRPGGEEGDDEMDAGDYVAALNGAHPANLAGFTDFLSTLGKDTAATVLTDVGKGLQTTKPVVVIPSTPMSTGVKIFIALAVAVPVLYFVTRPSASAPAVAHNPRRRRRRR